jgi:hypothetical protein
MAAFIMMRQAEGWSLYRDGAQLSPPTTRNATLELTIRMARAAAQSGDAVSLVIDEDPDGPAPFDFRLSSEPTMYFRPSERRAFDDEGALDAPAITYSASVRLTPP